MKPAVYPIGVESVPFYRRPAFWIVGGIVLVLAVASPVAWHLFIKPRLALWHAHRGEDHLHNKEFELAAASYGRAVALYPGTTFSAFWLSCKGNSLAMMGRPLEAIPAYEEAIRLDPRMTFVYTPLACCFLGTGRGEEALATVDRLQSAEPEKDPPYMIRAKCLNRLGRWEEALIAANRAQELYPNEPGAQLHAGNALCGLHRWDDALAAFDRAIATPDAYGWIPEVHLGRGRALAALGRHPEARESLKCFLEGEGATLPEATEAQALLDSLPPE